MVVGTSDVGSLSEPPHDSTSSIPAVVSSATLLTDEEVEPKTWGVSKPKKKHKCQHQQYRPLKK